ncbi:mitochondrial ribosomal protein MRP51 [Geopyxis carbonaria]|nr:mitochondrial ribosomal protein MRP51 [Geopyxis carbonaria]
MSSKKYSPAANLLRHSRLMAMPAPLPPAPTHNIFSPPPAPHPTVQAITTPPSSAFRGDWGLKRDIPLRVSHSTKYLRYNELDTLEHMTTFESAHDDVITLKKWQEMDITISKDAILDNYSSMSSSFAARPTVFDSDTKAESYKWRYNGPYLADMTAGEMRDYITKHVKPRQAEFYKFVARKQFMERLREQHTGSGKDISYAELQIEAEKHSEEHEVDILELRANSNSLEKLVYEFLDIPVQGRPHRTHPSAGLYYARSHARMQNNPETGAQNQRKAIPGRELNHNKELNTKMIGLGGVVARLSRTGFGSRGSQGSRFEVRKFMPMKAVVNPSGKIQLEVEEEMPAWGASHYKLQPNGRPRNWALGERKSTNTDSIIDMLANYKKK